MTLSLHEQALFCVKNYKRSELELLNILGLIDEDKTYLAFGVSSLFRYCVEILKLSEADTMKFIQVTRKAVAVPELKHAIARGEITTAKASRIASVITPENHLDWIQKAKDSNHRTLEREVAVVNPLPPIKEKIRALNAIQSELRVTLSIEMQKKLERVQEIFKTRSLQEALDKSLDLVLEKKDPLEKAYRFEKRKESKPKEHRTCNVVNLRPIPSEIKHKVYLRDKGKCTFKNCGESRYVQIHHKKPFSQGGLHTLENLVTLCSAHHHMLHDAS